MLDMQAIHDEIAKSGVVKSEKQEYDEGAFDIEFVNKILADRDKYKLEAQHYKRICKNREEINILQRNKIKRLTRERHVYKCELGKCQRKLERIYDYLRLHFTYYHNIGKKDAEDYVKNLKGRI